MTRLTRILILVAFVASHVGFPATDLSSAPRGSYPCEGHGCGCRSADHCWQHCCCMSLSDRLAWAAEHHVSPPSDLIAQAENAEPPHNEGLHIDARHNEGLPCHTEDGGSCCKHESESATNRQSENTVQFHWLMVIAAAKCKGNAFQSWTGADPSVLASKMSFAFESPAAGTVLIINESLERHATEPPLSYG